jgi:hypothetical protein
VAKKRNGERGGGGGIAGHTDMNGVFWRVKKAYNSGGIVTYLAYRLHLKL